MSQNVEEMVIKWSIDSTNFNKGVTSINRSMNVLKSEFKATDTNLKNFGNTTERLKNKQDYLTKTIELQAKKVQTLKAAYEKSRQETGENSSATQNLAIKVNNAANYYSNLEKQLREVNKELENEKWTSFANKLDKSGTAIKNIGSTLTTKLTTPIIGLGAVCTKTALTFEDSMAKFSSIMDKSAVSTEDMKASVMELSNQTGISASEIAEAGYTAISSGASTADALNVVKSNAVLAKTGFTDLATAMDLSTTVMNAYGMNADQLSHISDVLNVTQDKGKTTIGALGESMGNVIPTATMYNVKLEQLSAGYAALTKNGIQTSQAGVALNAMLSELGKSGTKASDIIKEKAGKSFQELMASGMNLNEVLEIVSNAAKESGLSIGDIFSNKNAIKGASSLTKNASDFVDSLNTINNTAGITDDKLSQLQTTNTGIKKALNDLKNAAIQFGSVITPVVSSVAAGVKGVADKLNGLNEGQRKVVVTIGAIVAAIGPALVIFGTMASSISKLITLYGLFKGSLLATRLGVIGLTVAEKAKMIVDKAAAIAQGTLNLVMSMNPITLIIIGITALIALAVVLYKKCEPFRNFINQLWGSIKSVFSKIVPFIKSAFDKMVNVVKTAINVIKVVIMVIVEIVKGIVNLILLPWKFLWENCKQYIFTAFEAIRTFILAYVEWWKGNWETFKTIVFTVWNVIKDTIVSVWEAIKGAIQVAIDFIKNNIIAPLQPYFKAIWNGIKSVIEAVWNTIKSTIENVISGIKIVWQGITSVFSSVCNAISGVWNNVTSTISSVWNSIVSGVISAWNTIKAPFESVVNGIKSVWEGIKSMFKLPHFKIAGELSLNPPSVPHLDIEWYANGGIMTRPTMFGMNGSSAMVGGEAGAEAILPLSALWNNLDKFLDEKLDNKNNKPIYITMQNILDGKKIGEETYKIVDKKLALAGKKVR